MVFLPLFQIELWAVSPMLRACTVNVFSHSGQCFYFTGGKLRPRKGSGQPKEREHGHSQPWRGHVLLSGCGPTSFLTQPPLPLLHLLSSTFCLLETCCHLKTHHMTLPTSAHCPHSLPAFPAGLAPGCLHLPSLASSILLLALAHCIRLLHLPFLQTALIKMTKDLGLTGAAGGHPRPPTQQCTLQHLSSDSEGGPSCVSCSLPPSSDTSTPRTHPSALILFSCLAPFFP